MPREVTCSFALSGLHEHCNNKIAWFKSELIEEHREWLMNFVADARSTVLRSQQDEPVSVLPPRTPRAPRKRRGAAVAAAANIAGTSAEVQENEMPMDVEPAVPDRRSPATSAAATSAVTVSFAATPPSPKRQSRRQQQKAPSPVEVAKAESPAVVVPARTPSPQPPPAASTRSMHSSRFEVPETPMEPSACSLRSSASAVQPAEISPAAPLSGGKSKASPRVTPEDVEQTKTEQENCPAALVLSPQSSDTCPEPMDMSSTAAPEVDHDSSSRGTTPTAARSVTPASSCSPQEVRQLRSATAAASTRGSYLQEEKAPAFVLTPQLSKQISEPIDVPSTLAAGGSECCATPKDAVAAATASKTPIEPRQLRSAKSAPSTTKASLRKPGRTGGKAVPSGFASPMPLCFGVQAHVKATPHASQAAAVAAEPPSASRILRSALRKHGAEADNFLEKLKPSHEQSAMLRLGAPLRAFQVPSPGNSGDEADDEQPKVLRKLNNLVSSVSSFIPHVKTPKALDSKAKQDKLKAEVDAKQKQAAERKRKKEELRLQELEEKKQKRAERELLTRKRKAEMDEERNAKLLKKTTNEQPSTSRAAAAVAAAAAQRKKEQEETRRKEQRRLEAETKRRQEEEQKQKRRMEAAKKYTSSSSAASRTATAASSSSAASGGTGLSAARSALTSPRLAAKTAKPASPRPAAKNNSSLASAQLSRVFHDTTTQRSALAPPMPSSGGSGGRICSGGSFLKKTLSKTVGSSDTTKTTASKPLPEGASKKPFVAVAHQPMDTSISSLSTIPDSSTDLAHGSATHSGTTSASTTGAAKRPPTPSCSNIVRAFPTSTTNKSSGSVVSSVPGASSSSLASTKTTPASKPGLPFSLRPIPELDAEVNAKRTAVAAGSSSTLPVKTSTTNSAHRSPLKSVNRTYTMPSSMSKKTDSPQAKSRTFTLQHSANTSLLDSSYGMQNQSTLSPSQMYSNYNIDHIESDDPTDDEDSPRRKIPKWAQQGPLKRALIDQELAGNVADNLFPVTDLETPNLTRIFRRERQRYLKRTSSAEWSSPIFKRL